MADWAASADGQQYTGFVTTQNGVLGTIVTLPLAAQGKLRDFTTIIASTTTDASGIFVAIPTQTGAAARYFVDIAVGAAGFETIIIPNLYLTYPAATRAGQEVFFPVTVPTGTRISARIQSTLAATAGLEINVRLMASGLSVTPSRSLVTTWGDTPATTNGTTIPAPGAINTYGSLVELKVIPYTSGGAYSTAVLATAPANLVGYWRMGESGTVGNTNLVDATANLNNAVAHGTATYGVTGALINDADTAISLNGADANYFEAPVAASLEVGDSFTAASWFQKAENGRHMTIISRGSPGFEFYISPGGNIAWGQAFNANFLFSNATINDFNWHMVAVIKNAASSFQCIIDGALAPISGFNTTCNVASLTTQIGHEPGISGSGFNGVLDEVALWNAPLGSSAITALYQKGLQRVPGAGTTNPYPVEEIIVNVQSSSITSANIRGVLSICIGPAGAQEIAAIPISANSAVLTPGQNFLGPFPCHIPAGTNVWGKLRWSSLTAPVPSIEVTIYGVS